MLKRPTARVVLLNARAETLLFECRVGDRRFWTLPGGGVELGETFEDAARRELREETGIAVATVGPCVLETEAIGMHPDHGDVQIVYSDRIFLVRSDDGQERAVDPEAVARAGYERHRWWSLAELHETDADVAPRQLAGVLADVLAGPRADTST